MAPADSPHRTSRDGSTPRASALPRTADSRLHIVECAGNCASPLTRSSTVATTKPAWATRSARSVTTAREGPTDPPPRATAQPPPCRYTIAAPETDPGAGWYRSSSGGGSPRHRELHAVVAVLQKPRLWLAHRSRRQAPHPPPVDDVIPPSGCRIDPVNIAASSLHRNKGPCWRCRAATATPPAAARQPAVSYHACSATGSSPPRR